MSLEEIQSKVYHCQFSGDQATHSRDISMNFNKKSQGHLNLISSLIAKARVCCAGFGVDTYVFIYESVALKMRITSQDSNQLESLSK